MRPDIPFLQEQFRSWNKRIFNDALPEVPIVISNAKSYLGKCEYHYSRSLFGKRQCRNFCLRFSARYDVAEEVVVDTLLHEMIHYYIAYKGIKDTSAHGERFRQMMNNINATYDRHLTITHRTTEDERQSVAADKIFVFCVTTMESGERCITVIAQTRLFEFWDEIPRRIRGVTHTAWYLTTDVALNRYPRSRTIKLYRIAETELDRLIQNSKPLVREGDVIRVARKCP